MKRIILILSIAVMWFIQVAPASAALALIVSGADNQGHTGTSITNSVNNTASASANPYMVVSIMTQTGTDALTSVTYGGQSLSLLAKRQSTNTVTAWTYYYGLANPPTGSNNLVVNYSTSLTTFIAWTIYEGINATQPDASSGHGNGNQSGFTINITTTSTHTTLLMTTQDMNGGQTAGTNTVRVSAFPIGNGVQLWASSAEKTTQGTYSLNTSGVNGGGEDGLAIALNTNITSSTSTTSTGSTTSTTYSTDFENVLVLATCMIVFGISTYLGWYFSRP